MTHREYGWFIVKLEEALSETMSYDLRHFFYDSVMKDVSLRDAVKLMEGYNVFLDMSNMPTT
jgi:hypothetical protein